MIFYGAIEETRTHKTCLNLILVGRHFRHIIVQHFQTKVNHENNLMVYSKTRSKFKTIRPHNFSHPLEITCQFPIHDHRGVRLTRAVWEKRQKSTTSCKSRNRPSLIICTPRTTAHRYPFSHIHERPAALLAPPPLRVALWRQRSSDMYALVGCLVRFWCE